MPRAAKATGPKSSVKKVAPVSKKTKGKVSVLKQNREVEIEKDKNKTNDAELFRKIKSDYRWKVYAQSASITLSSIFVLGGSGWMIDSWIGSGKHTFLIILLAISYPLTLIALYKKMKNFKIPKQK